MIVRKIICAATAAAILALVAPIPTQAAKVDPGVNKASIVQDAYWYNGRNYYHRRWHCWHARGVRRCAWRYW
jgi:hypothetical protein